MSDLLFITADLIGATTGGGLVAEQERTALLSLASQKGCGGGAWGADDLKGGLAPEPWRADGIALHKRDWFVRPPKLAHFYSGSFPETARALKRRGAKISWTIAAHDREVSRREHEKFGIPFSKHYPHLVDSQSWKHYISGYALADVIICPSSAAAKTVRAYGPEFENKRIEIIPHGCELPEATKPFPKTFTVGYLGSYGCDKSVYYLMEAWKKLAYADAMLVLAGRDSLSPHVRALWDKFGGGNVYFAGWQKDVSTFYNSISLYVQPSATEGFGLEVLEAMAHGRPVVCSDGAGAVDLVDARYHIRAGDTDDLAGAISHCRDFDLEKCGQAAREVASQYTWGKIRQKYADVWSSLL